ncbi:recombinase family protein [Sphingopyxis flava]|uniref:Site-specific DNA recombinase n=1 Tax=Sphingopyxis flava TaxID=1507287 RepID=A0A1T5DS68_9SPHN|nr:recombinase family protein [Sphingopyxis flava]SKB74489.1 Site-specific DNA recombinase [Sphingopyxis flava]
MREAVLYARVSTPDQEKEGYSIPAQVKLLEDYAAQNGIDIVSRHIDVETARKSGRKAFEEMLRHLRRRSQVRILLVEKTDRLYRNIKDWATIDELGIEVHFVKENVVMSEGCRSSEKFVHGIKVLMAKAYIDNLGEERSKGMVEKAQQGIWPSCAPIGYNNVVDVSGRKVIAVDPERGALVSRLFDWFSTGEHSLKSLADKARAAGLTYRKSGKPIGTSTVHNILRSRIYTGAFEWMGVTYAGLHVPLTSSALWDAVQTVLDRRSHDSTHSRVEDFAFRGLAKCGHCGCALVAEIKKGRYIYYHCSGYYGKCPEPYVRQERLEEHFIALLLRLHCGPVQFRQLRRAIVDMHEETGAATSAPRTIGAARGNVGALIDDGIAMLNMARTSNFGLGALSVEVKRQALQLLLAGCSWANGELTATFNEPFDMLAGYVARTRSGTADTTKGQGEIVRLLEALRQPTPETRQLIARYNAMLRIQADIDAEKEGAAELDALAA